MIDRAEALPIWLRSPRHWLVPTASVLIGSAAPLLPMIASAPVVPPLGFLMLLAWRVLRPEFWPLWIGLPLGLVDDLLSGAPMGTAVLAWTICLVAFEPVDKHLIWRDYWQELIVFAAALLIHALIGWAVALVTTGRAGLLILLPQAAIGLLLVPAILRLAARLDRWRLRR